MSAPTELKLEGPDGCKVTLERVVRKAGAPGLQWPVRLTVDDITVELDRDDSAAVIGFLATTLAVSR
jgi:hypothetical protein